MAEVPVLNVGLAVYCPSSRNCQARSRKLAAPVAEEPMAPTPAQPVSDIELGAESVFLAPADVYMSPRLERPAVAVAPAKKPTTLSRYVLALASLFQHWSRPIRQGVRCESY